MKKCEGKRERGEGGHERYACVVVSLPDSKNVNHSASSTSVRSTLLYGSGSTGGEVASTSYLTPFAHVV